MNDNSHEIGFFCMLLTIPEDLNDNIFANSITLMAIEIGFSLVEIKIKMDTSMSSVLHS
jgi:hypothetical protein